MPHLFSFHFFVIDLANHCLISEFEKTKLYPRYLLIFNVLTQSHLLLHSLKLSTSWWKQDEKEMPSHACDFQCKKKKEDFLEIQDQYLKQKGPLAWLGKMISEPPHDKTNKMTVRPAKTDQPGHPPSLIRVFTVRMKKAWVLSYPLSTQWIPRLIWVFAGRTLILLVLSCRGSCGFLCQTLFSVMESTKNCLLEMLVRTTVKFLKIWTPEKITLIILWLAWLFYSASLDAV